MAEMEDHEGELGTMRLRSLVILPDLIHTLYTFMGVVNVQ